MKTISVRAVREDLRSVLDRVSSGEEMLISRRGEPVACICPPHRETKRLPSLREFRSAIAVRGRSLSQEVAKARDEERF